ncbi:MAG TPA: alpha/beta fold hydrolase [Deltaproteobacteria bacterium]|nr:alpha/beta fold hydrolase [Deltaproteobacteria bacterium]
MNPIAYRTTGLLIKTLSYLSKARINIHGKENIPTHGSIIFVINHFTRIETFLMPYFIYRLTQIPVWSLADDSLFKGAFGRYLDTVGAVSTKNPDRDQLMVKTLLTGEAHWIIFPEGGMVKSKKIIDKGRFMVFFAGGKRPPHTGAATLALRTEFYRKRLQALHRSAPEEAARILNQFKIDDIEPVLNRKTLIVPVNLTYYPLRARENFLNHLAERLVENIPDRIREEIMAEGAMLISGVDIDMRFGQPILIEEYLNVPEVTRDIMLPRRIGFDDPISSRQTLRKIARTIMMRYMRTIYYLTTVNPDHLFASIIRLIPWRTVDPYALRQRAYLAATGNLLKLDIFYHQSLKHDQTHLLTDDRFNRFKNFISLALEKEVLKEKDGRFKKNMSKFSRSIDFHRVRVENPVSVMANEVEPLVHLQRYLRKLCLIPNFWLRRKIIKYLMNADRKEFAEDYRTFYVDGESKDKTVGRPFLVRGRSKRLGILLIHGYMAAPREVKALADYLGKQGFWVYVPRLRGHGTSPDDLAHRSYKDWINSVDRGFAVIRNLCRDVVVGGFSTGAGLALELAARVKEVAGVFGVCPPMRLHDLSAKLVPAVDAWNRLMKRVQLNGVKMEFVDNHPENPDINYTRNPISGVRELERLMEVLEPKLPEIDIPALIVQSSGDPIVDPKGSRRIFELLGSKDKQYILFHLQRHGILLGEDSHAVHKAIGGFIENLM